MGMLLFSRPWKTCEGIGKKMQQYQGEILEENLIESARHLRLGRRSVFQKDNDLKRRATALQY